MPRAARVCSTPGCPNFAPCRIHSSSRDPRSSRNHRGVSRHRRGLGADHDRARREVLGTPCVLQLPGCTGVAETLEHVVPRSQGGTLEDGFAGACLHCQRAQGAALAVLGEEQA